MNFKEWRKQHGTKGLMKTYEDSFFKNIPTFNWLELDGKTLEIKANISEGIETVMGKDIDTGNLYLLKQDRLQ